MLCMDCESETKIYYCYSHYFIINQGTVLMATVLANRASGCVHLVVLKETPRQVATPSDQRLNDKLCIHLQKYSPEDV